MLRWRAHADLKMHIRSPSLVRLIDCLVLGSVVLLFDLRTTECIRSGDEQTDRYSDLVDQKI
jgi:hypothetical protein